VKFRGPAGQIACRREPAKAQRDVDNVDDIPCTCASRSHQIFETGSRGGFPTKTT